MRVLLSTIGTRGKVQPLVALASRLRELDHGVDLCAPPDFREWVGTFGIPFTPVGPELRGTATARPPAAARPSPERMRELAEGSVAAQFTAITTAARGCDVVVAGGALQLAARSVAEQLGIPYVYAGYCPITLPSPHHAPPSLSPDAPVHDTSDNVTSWARDAERWNALFGAAIEPPVYFGFGSIRAPHGVAATTVETARALGRRAIISRDWTDLALPDDGPDCLSIGDVNQHALFQRVAAVRTDRTDLAAEYLVAAVSPSHA